MNATASNTNVKKYSNERLMTLLLAPIVSEKGTYVADKHEQVIFRVAPDATKPEIKAAVELMFKVQVDSVQGFLCDLLMSARPFCARVPWRPLA